MNSFSLSSQGIMDKLRNNICGLDDIEGLKISARDHINKGTVVGGLINLEKVKLK